MHITIIALSCAISILATVPYQLDIIRGRSKPRIATWLVWGILSIIGGIAAFADHQVPAGVYTIAISGECLLVVALGFRLGDRKFDRLDITCLIAAFAGLLALVVLKSPTLAIIVAIATDFISTVPTFMHSWKKPYEETLWTYFLFVLSEWIILLITNYKIFTSFAFPLFYLLEDGSLALIVMLSPHRRDANKLEIRLPYRGVLRPNTPASNSKPGGQGISAAGKSSGLKPTA